MTNFILRGGNSIQILSNSLWQNILTQEIKHADTWFYFARSVLNHYVFVLQKGEKQKGCQMDEDT